jgi:hypothetical protein
VKQIASNPSSRAAAVIALRSVDILGVNAVALIWLVRMVTSQPSV